jgi:2-haloacid dehalogenase/putative hydrolase of the HAD superfamily
MKYRALMLDFYGTLVAEDEVLVARIAERIAGASRRGASAGEVRARWADGFSRICAGVHGADFRTQREIEQASLEAAAEHFDARIDVAELCAEMFAYWAAPTPLPGAAEFLSAYDGPICIVSNIDTADLRSAISGLGWELERVVTSESCRAYKPRPEMFRAALAILGCEPSEVLHVGDSPRSDIVGAAGSGIDVAWVNATERALPAELAARPRHTIRSVAEVLPLLG